MRTRCKCQPRSRQAALAESLFARSPRRVQGGHHASDHCGGVWRHGCRRAPVGADSPVGADLVIGTLPVGYAFSTKGRIFRPSQTSSSMGAPLASLVALAGKQMESGRAPIRPSNWRRLANGGWGPWRRLGDFVAKGRTGHRALGRARDRGAGTRTGCSRVLDAPGCRRRDALGPCFDCPDRRGASGDEHHEPHRPHRPARRRATRW